MNNLPENLLLTFCILLPISVLCQQEQDKIILSATSLVEVSNHSSVSRLNPEHPVSESVAYDHLTRILFDFDLQKARALDFANLEKAVIRISFSKVDNPAGETSVLGTMDVKWQDKATELQSVGEPWSIRGFDERTGKRSRFEYKLLDTQYALLPNTKTLIKQPGLYEFDVTDELNQQLYCGKKAYGFMFRTGPQHLTGRDNRGNWKLEFDGTPTLELTFSGKPPTIAQQRQRTLKYFPSASLPPVSNPYIFCYYNWNNDFNKLLWPRLKVINTDVVFDDTALNQKGILTLSCKGGPQFDWMGNYETCFNIYSNARFGITVDEWQSVDDSNKRNENYDHDTPMGKRIDTSIKALAAVKEKFPNMLLGVYWRGEISLKPLAAKGLPDLVISEGYTHLPRFPQWEIGTAENIHHFDWAKEDGYYEQTICLHGAINIPMQYPGYDHHFTPESLAEEVRVLRKKYPEVMGSGLYCEISKSDNEEKAAWKWNPQEAMEALWPVFEGYERALQRYFIDPAPDVILTSPEYEAKITSAKVLLKAEAMCKDQRKMLKYRWFVDNRLVAETTVSEYLWDTRDTESGHHVLTVHAIDDGWNRAAAQIPVTLDFHD